MRLSQQEIALIHEAIKSHIDCDYQLRLYGSRLDVKARGGDIDLLLLVPTEALDNILMIKHLILVGIKNKIGDQKIDLSIVDEHRITEDPFLKKVYRSSCPI